MNWDLFWKIAILALYVAGMLAIAFFTRKRSKTVGDTLLGNRSMGGWITAFAYGTTYFSAVIFIGYAGEQGYTFGFHSLWIGAGNAFIGATLAWILLGRRTRNATVYLGTSTMPEYFAARYDGHIGNTGLNDLDLFIDKHLKGRAVFVPSPVDISIEEDDGELVARIKFDRNGEALREIAADIEEGADIVMVKPALAYLDVLKEAALEFSMPFAVYNVSGEYAMVKAAAQNGWIDERKIVAENLTAMKRAGAKIIITYHALDMAAWLKEEEQG